MQLTAGLDGGNYMLYFVTNTESIHYVKHLFLNTAITFIALPLFK